MLLTLRMRLEERARDAGRRCAWTPKTSLEVDADEEQTSNARSDRSARRPSVLAPSPRAGAAPRSSRRSTRPPREKLPAAPFVAAAYGFIWVAVLAYVVVGRARAGARVHQRDRRARSEELDGAARAARQVIVGARASASPLVALHLHPGRVHPGHRHRLHAGRRRRATRSRSEQRKAAEREARRRSAPRAGRRRGQPRTPATSSGLTRSAGARDPSPYRA